MPILKPEDDLYPSDLLERNADFTTASERWFCLYTLARQEKKLMRKLKKLSIGFYGPMIAKRSRSPQGRLRVSTVPLFPNYVFLFGTAEDRQRALGTNCVSRVEEVGNPQALAQDLQQIYLAIREGVPLTPEARLIPGQPVRVRSGPFRGYEGTVLRREGKTRLLLTIRYLEQGVSMQIDEGLLEPL
jgi:transcription antitermination factor NusG